MNAMLTDEDLERLLEEAARSFSVPTPELEVPEQRIRLWQRRWPQVGAAAALVVAGSLLFAGPGGGGGSTAHTARSLSLAPSSEGSVHRAGAAAGLVSGGSAGTPTGPTPQDQGARVGAGGSASGAGGLASTAPLQDGARVVRTGEIDVAVDKGKVQAAVEALELLVTKDHGYEADSSDVEVGDSPSAQLTVRVPVAAFSSFIQSVRKMPLQVVSVQQSGKDVTSTYADTGAQIQSLTAARDHYGLILQGAKTIGETLSVQERIDGLQRQIDQLTGQQKLLANQSDFGTLTVSVAEKGAAQKALVAPAPSGWSRAWHRATHGFTSGVQSLIGASGRTLLVLICGAALFFAARSGWRLARRRLV